MQRIAPLLGIGTAETLRKWVRRAPSRWRHSGGRREHWAWIRRAGWSERRAV